TCDALWMGVPVVSLVGSSAIARGGLSILANVGLLELAVNSQSDYVAAATTLAGDLKRLKLLRGAMRQHMEASPLMNARQYARDVEELFRQAWRNYCTAPS